MSTTVGADPAKRDSKPNYGLAKPPWDLRHEWPLDRIAPIFPFLDKVLLAMLASTLTTVLARCSIARRELNPVGYKILIEVLARGDVRTIVEVGYVFQIRQDGQSKVTWRQYVDYVRHLLRLRRSRKAR